MSYLRPDRDTPDRQKQRGAAFIVMLVVLVLGIATVLVASLSTAGLKIERDVKTTEALAQAKDALIGEAAIHDKYPGSLPCPDTDDNGVSDAGGGSDCPLYIGRLPWKTLGLPDLRDAAGERLWYVLSRNVRRYDSVRPLNSDVTGTLNITGTSPENNLMAIVFAPGSAIGGQRRSSTQSALCATTNNVIPENRCATNYLEGSNGDLDPNLNFQNANANVEFNDQLISISHDQLFTTTEKRVGNEIKNILKTYYAAWGAFPFPVPFTDPSTSTYRGLAGTYEGLLPVADDVIPTWAGVPTYTFSGSGSLDYCELRDGFDTNSRWRCRDISISTGETITITGRINNVGLGLWRPYHIGNICEVRARNSSGVNKLVTEVLDNVTLSFNLNPAIGSAGSAEIIFQAKGKSGHGTLQRIELRDLFDYTTDIRNYSDTDCDPKASPTDTLYNPTSNSPVIPAWLFNSATAGNDWHKLAYYSVAEEFAPKGDHTCTPIPCLTVTQQNGTDDVDIPAIILMSGRIIAGSPPRSILNDFLEGTNQSTGDRDFENLPRSTTFNDQVIIIAP